MKRSFLLPTITLVIIALAGCVPTITASPTNSPVESTPAPSPAPTIDEADPGPEQSLYVSHLFRVSLRVPNEWDVRQLDVPGEAELRVEEPYRGLDGWFQVSSLMNSDLSLSELCDAPDVVRVAVDGQEGCIVSDDQQSTLIARYPSPIRSSFFSTSFDYVTVASPPEIIVSLADSLDFSILPDDYLAATIDYIEQNAYYGNDLDWNAVRTEAYDKAEGADSFSETYDAIRFVLSRLGDRHSTFFTPDRVVNLQSSSLNRRPNGQVIQERLGYVVIPSVSGSVDKARQYAQSGQRVIQQLDEQGVCGWIVDLRDNEGGNVYPMAAAVGPLLGNGEFGGYRYASGDEIWLSYDDGLILANDVPLSTYGDLLFDPAYAVNQSNPPVAVLTSRRTGSSGEMTLIAFIGRPHTRVFGQATAGLTTSNSVKELFDGAWIALTTGVDFDRNGQAYGQSVTPDVELTEDTNEIEIASDWLLEQDACQNQDS